MKELLCVCAMCVAMSLLLLHAAMNEWKVSWRNSIKCV